MKLKINKKKLRKGEGHRHPQRFPKSFQIKISANRVPNAPPCRTSQRLPHRPHSAFVGDFGWGVDSGS